MYRPIGLFILVVVSGCYLPRTSDLWDGVSQRTLTFPQVFGIVQRETDARRPAILVVRYRTSVDPSPSDPGFCIGIPLDACGQPLDPFAVALDDVPREPGEAPAQVASTTMPAGHRVPARRLTTIDFQRGREAVRSPRFLRAGAAGGVATGGMQADDPTTTRINYRVLDAAGHQSADRWVQLPRHVDRPSKATPGEVAGAAVMTPVTVTLDVVTIVVGLPIAFAALLLFGIHG